MSMRRRVTAELLDGLAADDPAARGSRRDLQHLHRLMGTRDIVARVLLDASAPQYQYNREYKQDKRGASPSLRVLELGAGDGSLMLGVARAVNGAWPAVELTLLDRHDLVDRSTLDAYAELGWTATVQVADVLDWAAGQGDMDSRPDAIAPVRWDLIITHLFLHHFAGAQLTRLIHAIAARTDRFVACEPRRAWLALAGSHMVGAIGANAITREDAVLSVRAGFRDAEISELWPAYTARWKVDEYAAGLFSHCFRAERCGAQGAEGY